MFDLRRSSGGFGGLVDRAGQVSSQKIKAQWRHVEEEGSDTPLFLNYPGFPLYY